MIRDVARIQAEEIARSQLVNKTKQDITLNEIYHAFQNLTQIDDKTTRLICEAEVTCEIALTYPNKFCSLLITKLIEEKKKFILTTDMYLPRFAIEAILSKSKILGYEKILISSELNRSKHFGDLYDDVIKYFNVSPEKIVHIGDNKHSDINSAKAKSLNSYFYDSSKHYLQTKYINKNSLMRGNSPLKHIFIANYFNRQASQDVRSLNLDNDNEYWRAFGQLVFAPILTSLVFWIQQQSDDLNLSKIAFLARDGKIVKRAFNHIFPDQTENTIYLAASRRMLTLPHRVLSPKEIKNYFVHGIKKFSTGNELLEKIVGSSKLKPRLIELGFDLNSKLNRRQRRQLIRAIGENSGLLTLSMIKEKSTISEYLSHELFTLTEYRIGIFDLGWRGTLQSSIEKIFPHKSCNLVGLYFGTNRDALDILFKKGSSYKSFSMQNGFPDRHRKLCQEHTNLIEFLFSATHGSVEGIEKDGDQFKWRYSEISSREAVSHSIVSIIQESAIEAIADVIAQIDSKFLSNLNSREHDLADFDMFLRQPDKKDATHFSKVYVFSGIGDDEGSPISGRNFKRFFYYDFKKSHWKSGYLANVTKFERMLIRIFLGFKWKTR